MGLFRGGPSGNGAIVLESVLGLRASGVDVTMFATHEARVPPVAESLVTRLAPMPRSLHNPRVQQALQLVRRRLEGQRLARALEDRPVDVVHLFSAGMAPALPERQRTVVQSWFWPPRLRGRLRTMMPLAPRNPLAAAHLLAEVQAHVADRLGYRSADLVLANTERAAADLRALGLPVQVIPPCITLPAAPPVRSPSRTLRAVLSAYNLTTPRKGLRLLLDALPLVRGARLHLTLVGAWDDSLGRRVDGVRAAGHEVRVLGRVPRERYLELLAHEADLLAMPSLYEEWGFALFEALSRGVPALTLDRYPYSDVLDEATGLLAAAATPGALAAGLERALAGALPSSETVFAATRERFGPQATTAKLLAAYEGLSASA